MRNAGYRLKNGYTVRTGEFYDGYNMNTKWCIYCPSGNLYMSCGSYREAIEIASHLVEEV